MRVIMTGGGTGGHIYPAIAIADRILYRTNGSEILFIGTERGLERELVPKFGYDIRFINVRGLNRRSLVKNIGVLKDYLQAKKDAKKIIAEFKPDLVIGTGGYVCGPVIKAASEMGIKTYIHEQNAFPGLTNKLLERVVDKVFLGFEEAATFFKRPHKHVFAGNPVRDEFFKIKKPRARGELGIEASDFVVLSFGGSRGAGRINKAMLQVISNYHGMPGVQIYMATGPSYYKAILQEIKDMGIDDLGNIHVLEYIDHMEYYLAAADLVICRSGALTVAEVSVVGTPAILIPSPNVTGDHQSYNARVLADRGGALLLNEVQLTGEALIDRIQILMDDREGLEAMSQITRSLAPLDASDIIYYNISQ